MLSKLNLTVRDLKLWTCYSEMSPRSSSLIAGLGSYPNLLFPECSSCSMVSPALGVGRCGLRKSSWQPSPYLPMAGTAPGALQTLHWPPCTYLQPLLLHHQEQGMSLQLLQPKATRNALLQKASTYLQCPLSHRRSYKRMPQKTTEQITSRKIERQKMDEMGIVLQHGVDLNFK